MASIFGFDQTPDPSGSASARLPEVVDEFIPQELTEREKAVRDLFASEYLVDRDQVAAAMRCGFDHQFAVEHSAKWMKESYVIRQINRFSLGYTGDEAQLEEYNRRRIREGLLQEAFYRGPGSSHAARVSALKALAELNGMSKKAAPEEGNRGGVMQVPAIADLDNWEAAASESQDGLVRHADTGE